MTTEAVSPVRPYSAFCNPNWTIAPTMPTIPNLPISRASI